jgi:hypothetical protein
MLFSEALKPIFLSDLIPSLDRSEIRAENVKGSNVKSQSEISLTRITLREGRFGSAMEEGKVIIKQKNRSGQSRLVIRRDVYVASDDVLTHNKKNIPYL